MENHTDTPLQPCHQKAPYERPELVVLGTAAAMTQTGIGALSDATVIGAANSGS
jgi:hypothetical protein